MHLPFTSETRALALPDAQVDLFERLTLGFSHDALMQQLTDDIQWRQEDITLFGKTYRQPRLIAWHGDDKASYRYSGRVYEPQPWTDLLLQLKHRVEAASGSQFNSVLLNLYRDGRDSMGLHADDEPELGPEPVIASLSLGATRTLYFKHRFRKDLATLRVPLSSGSLLVMRGSTQQYWKHGIRKLSRQCGPRINLTFRHIVPGKPAPD